MTRVTHLLACALVVLASVSTRAQNPPRDAAALVPPTGTAQISGVVLGEDDKPVRRVAVFFEGDGRTNRTALTDDQGRFAVIDMPAARYVIRAEKGGYPPSNYGAKRPGRPGSGLLVKDGEHVENLIIRMARGAVITGTLFDDRGQPLPGASVTAFAVETLLTGDFNLRAVARSGSAFPETDDRGMFRFYGLPAGEYIVGTSAFFHGLNDAVRVPTDAEIRAAFGSEQRPRAISTDPRAIAAAAEKSAQVNYAPVYFGDVSDPTASTRVKVAAGEERAGVDLHLKMQPTASISGKVTGPDGTVQRVTMNLATLASVPGQGSTRVSSAQPDGTFNYAGLAPGNYVVVAKTGTAPQLIAEAPVALNGQDVTGLQLALAPAMTATGKLQFVGTSLPPPDPAKIFVNLLTTTGYGYQQVPPAVVASSLDWTMDGVVPGKFRIVATIRDTPKPGAPAWMLSKVMLGDRDVTDVAIDVVAGQQLPPITVTFTDTASELTGTISTATGQPGTDYFVVVIPADQKFWLWNTRRIKSTRPDASGRYTFAGLPPGTYRVAATTELEQGDLANLTFLRELLTTSAEVVVGVGEKKIFDLKLGGGTIPPSTPTTARRR